MHKLPSMSSLRTFEAAARLGSFSLAADELSVTASAVSHQVKLLEEYTGVQLFRRIHRSVVLRRFAKTSAHVDTPERVGVPPLQPMKPAYLFWLKS
jgi:hypothetical protein